MPPTHEASVRERVDIGILTVIPPELDAARSALGSLKRVKEEPGGTVYWHGVVRSTLRECDYTVVLAGIGAAGTSSTASLASQMIERYRPSVVLLVGIAAGMRGKVRIGEVVLSERVVAYEMEALVADKDGVRTVEPRPEMSRVSHGILQDMINYQPDAKRLTLLFKRIEGTFPRAPRGKKKAWQGHVASSVTCKAQVTIASGDKLLRDPGKLRELRRDKHGKIEAGEMEAAGLVEACRVANIPWLVVRGISDFGDDFKNDEFHTLASKTAATVMADFVAHGLDLGEGRGKSSPRRGGETRTSPFVWGRPIERDQDFFGRDHEKGWLLNAIGKRGVVQILGGAKTGKSSLLRWLHRHIPDGKPVVRLDPGKGLSPTTLVAEIARGLGRLEAAASLSQADATVDQACRQLAALTPCVLLIDDANKLATTGHGFTEEFFEKIRGHVEHDTESNRLTWVSVSRLDLYDLFQQKGLTSRLFQSSECVWSRPLDAASARRLAEQGQPEYIERILREAGGFAYGLQWLGDRLMRGSDRADEACDAFRNEMGARVFDSWWELLSAEERALLKACARTEVDANGYNETMRQTLVRLTTRGYVDRDTGRFRLAAGEAWREFVLNAS